MSLCDGDAKLVIIRDDEGETEVQPGENHQLSNKTEKEVTYYCIADNPVTDHCYYPDSKKWSVRVAERKIIQGQKAEYFAGEDKAAGRGCRARAGGGGGRLFPATTGQEQAGLSPDGGRPGSV